MAGKYGTALQKQFFRKVDAVQNCAVRMGIIKEFVHIEDYIKLKDARLLNNITKTDSKHQLYDILPHRRDYCSERLKNGYRLPKWQSKRCMVRWFLTYF